MVAKRYLVRLEEEERAELTALLRKGKASARKRTRAQVLLKADEGPGGPFWTDGRIAEALEVHPNSVAGIRERFAEQGLAAALGPKKLPPRLRKLDGAKEAWLIAIACGQPPEGRAKWSLRLLAHRLVELEIVDEVSHETVRKTLKKTRSSPTATSTG